MIKKIEDLNYYELLEIGPSATPQEIHKAYERIRRVYEPNSIALYSLFSPEEIASIHQRIEDAYRTLVYEDSRRQYDAMLRSHEELTEPLPLPVPGIQTYQAPVVQPTLRLHSDNRHAAAETRPAADEPTPVIQPAAAVPVQQFTGEFTGPAIKLMREQRGLSLRNIADTTKVSARYLESIEEEQFAKLPARAYVRGFLSLYAKALGQDPERVINDYLKRYNDAMNPPKK